jgi:hypothetical protein
MRAHNDSVAIKYSAEEIFINNSTETEKLRRFIYEIFKIYLYIQTCNLAGVLC